MHRKSVEVAVLPVVDAERTAEFYQELGFRVVARGAEEMILERGHLQLVLQQTSELDPDDGTPRLEITVSIETLERVWRRDERDDPTLRGPTLSPEGAFEYRARDPSGNRVRIIAPIPDPELADLDRG
jgi:catechol 2,3-dioxygenase-like lactoylglutathione lyase family enzyme